MNNELDQLRKLRFNGLDALKSYIEIKINKKFNQLENSSDIKQVNLVQGNLQFLRELERDIQKVREDF